MKRQQTSPMDVNVKRQKSSSSSFQKQGGSSNSVPKNSMASSLTNSSSSSSTSSSSKPLNLDLLCAVPLATGSRCMNGLSCNIHTLGEKKLVQGRSADVKVLMARNIPDREYDEEEHCGVFIDGVGSCTRALSCNYHTVPQKRAVRRRVPFDTLMDYKKREREAKKAAREQEEYQARLNKLSNNDDGNAEEDEEFEDGTEYIFVPS